MNPKADAALYLLTGLLQRMEAIAPGIIKDMIEGVKADHASLPEDIKDKEHIEAIFKESLTLLNRAEMFLRHNS